MTITLEEALLMYARACGIPASHAHAMEVFKKV
jgi:hypothetical protein